MSIPAERSDELRIYTVIRDDLNFGRDGIVTLAGEVLAGLWHQVQTEQPELTAAYDVSQQPKIGVRAKTQQALLRARDEVQALGIPCFLRNLEAEPVCLAIGPVTRLALPKFVANLQLLADEPKEIAAPAPVERTAEEDDFVSVVLVREDAGIPYGKLVAQAGHGVLGPVLREDGLGFIQFPADHKVLFGELRSVREMEDLHQAALLHGLPSAFIVDAGRTVYGGQPTPTVVGVGPCRVRDLPEAIRSRIPALNQPACLKLG